MARAAFNFGCYWSRLHWNVAQFYCPFRKETFGACRSYGRMGKCIIWGDTRLRRRPPNGSPLTSGGRDIKLSHPKMAASSQLNSSASRVTAGAFRFVSPSPNALKARSNAMSAIGTTQTSDSTRPMSAFGGKADMVAVPLGCDERRNSRPKNVIVF